MNKEQLLPMGLGEEQISAIIRMHKETLDRNYITKHRFDEVNNSLKTTKEQLAERDQQIKDLKKFEGDNKALKERIEALETENKEKDKTHKEHFALERKKNAIKIALLADEAGSPHDVEMVMGLFDISKIDIDESGKLISGYKEQNENIRKEKAFLFNDIATKSSETDVKGLKFTGQVPVDANKSTKPIDNTLAYGKSLAKVKLGMLGFNANKEKE